MLRARSPANVVGVDRLVGPPRPPRPPGGGLVLGDRATPKDTKRAEITSWTVSITHGGVVETRSALFQSERLGGIGLGHQVDIRGRNAAVAQRLEKRDESVGMQRIAGLAEVARQDAVARARRRGSPSRNRRSRAPCSARSARCRRIPGTRRRAAASCICGIDMPTGGSMAWVTTMCSTPCATRLADDREALGRRGVPRLEHQLALRDDGDHLLDFGQQFARPSRPRQTGDSPSSSAPGFPSRRSASRPRGPSRP